MTTDPVARIITGAVTVNGIRYPVQVQVFLPAMPVPQLRVVPKAS